MYELSVLENFSLLELNSGLSNANPITKPLLHKCTKWCSQLNTLSLISPGRGGQWVQGTLFSRILPFAVPVSLSFILDLSSCCSVFCPHQFIQSHSQSPVLCFSFVWAAQTCYRELYMKAWLKWQGIIAHISKQLNLNKWINFSQVHQPFLFWGTLTLLYFFLGPWSAAIFEGLLFHFAVFPPSFTPSPQIHLPPISKTTFSNRDYHCMWNFLTICSMEEFSFFFFQSPCFRLCPRLCLLKSRSVFSNKMPVCTAYLAIQEVLETLKITAFL